MHHRMREGRDRLRNFLPESDYVPERLLSPCLLRQSFPVSPFQQASPVTPSYPNGTSRKGSLNHPEVTSSLWKRGVHGSSDNLLYPPEASGPGSYQKSHSSFCYGIHGITHILPFLF